MPLDHQALRRGLLFIFRWLSKVETTGLENLPATGGALVAVNHISVVDGPLVYAILPREDCTALAAKKYQRNFFSRWLLDSARVIWLDRENPDPRTLRTAIQRLDEGWVLGIAPEGTRSKSGTLIRAKPGAAYLSVKSKAVTLPMAVMGTESAFKELLRLRRPRLRVALGKPFSLPPLDRTDREGSLQRSADEIMCQIAALMPERYHGVYADHPRLKEILSSGANAALDTA
jgi:1-acyl-sn-glycerol-3-phosphate acyltransferase